MEDDVSDIHASTNENFDRNISKENGVTSNLEMEDPSTETNTELKSTEITSIASDNPKVIDSINGERKSQNEFINEDSYSDNEDALVIDEEPLKYKAKTSQSEIHFKGLKKRILAAQTSQDSNDLDILHTPVDETQKLDSLLTSNSDNSVETQNLTNTAKKEPISISKKVFKNPLKLKNPRPRKTKKSEKAPSHQKREYAQYLGLQPTVKFKCCKCSMSNFQTLEELKEHQTQCSSTSTAQCSTASSVSNNTTNFKLTRKVYLCSGCGTYYEAWNLFLHMREFHRRHICLVCLGLFSSAEKLSAHLSIKHGIIPQNYDNEQEFLGENSGEHFVMCVTCEKIFSQNDNFSTHLCEPVNIEREVCKVPSSSKDVSNNSQIRTQSDISKSSSASSNKTTLKTNNLNNNGKNGQKSVTKLTTVPKTNILKISKQKNKIVHTEHVTGDSPKASCFDWKISPNEVTDTSNTCTTEKSNVNEEPFVNSETNYHLTETNQVDCENKEINKDLNVDNSQMKCSDENSIENKKDSESEENIQDKSENSSMKTNESLNDTSIISADNCNDLNESQTDDILNNCNSSSNQETSINENKNMEYEYNENVFDKSENSANECDNDDKCESSANEQPVVEEVRRVPKVTLKIPPEAKVIHPMDTDSDSDDSMKLTVELDNGDDNPEENKKQNMVNGDSNEITDNNDFTIKSPNETEIIPTAGSDIVVIDLGLRPPLDKDSIQSLLKDFIKTTCYSCVYCNHARKIAVNGSQLGLHMIAEHRFSAIADSITAEELLPETFVARIKSCLTELEIMFFNLENYDSEEPEAMIPYDQTYECFQCRFVTTVHKELYLHNRKMHQKTILLCIMCKSTFYSYSELLCHLCPGSYTGAEVRFRCCLCPTDNLASAFRLMVHLRKRHHACDVCLETCGGQARLSNHVWKHKLHHLCYRCGIAYRNKPDITKHLFWKHGTESVLCKKCLQKKWPHVYHFCIPPTLFVCDECNVSFAKAVALKVHKRLHTDEKPYACTEEGCVEKCVSKKLLEKHIAAHREPPPIVCPTLENEADAVEDIKTNVQNLSDTNQPVSVCSELKSETKVEIESKAVDDVYNLPALNLSESDSDESDIEKSSPIVDSGKQDEPKENICEKEETEPFKTESLDEQKPVPVVDGIWDNFRNYQASVGTRDLNEQIKTPLEQLADASVKVSEIEKSLIKPDDYVYADLISVQNDHAYCVSNETASVEPEQEVKETAKNSNNDTAGKTLQQETSKKCKTPKKKKENGGSSSSSDSSSNSDSSSCTCGSNCSCSSSSSGSSSSSSSSSDSNSSNSENQRRIAARKERRKERAKNKSKTSITVDVVNVEKPAEPLLPPPIPIEICESDLCTDESETDEDFYDEYPHRLAKKLIEEKKQQLIMEVGGPPVINGKFFETSRSSTPNIPEEAPIVKKIKIKSKKRKKSQRNRSSPSHKSELSKIADYYNNQLPAIQSVTQVAPVQLPPQIATPITIAPLQTIRTPSLPSVKPSTPTISHTAFSTTSAGSGSETDSALRLSKRRRIPNKFYGYSSDEESTQIVKPPEPPQLKWDKDDLPTPVKSAPVVTQPKPEPVYIPPTWKPDSIVEPAVAQSTSDSSDSDDDSDDNRLQISHSTYPTTSGPMVGIPGHKPSENLYCYCQCPYDEVSEMIACDGKNCAIEWFHFECVGIMVPPKGKWFCPDCRKQQSNQRNEYFMT